MKDDPKVFPFERLEKGLELGGGDWLAQSVEDPTHNLRFGCEFQPHVRHGSYLKKENKNFQNKIKLN